MPDPVSTISAQVDLLREDLVAFLRKLVQFPSLPGFEQKAQYAVAEKLETLGLTTEIVPSELEDLQDHPAFCDDGVPFRDRLNVVGRWSGSDRTDSARRKKAAPHSLILNGHMDVVPTGAESLWSESPWSGTIRDGKLYGRGSSDMKAGLTANIFAVQALQAMDFRPAGDVLLESVIGEESGGAGTLATIVKGFRADAAIITEPTQLRVCPVQSGALSFRIGVSGRAIHACMKPYGVSALEKFYVVLAALQELEHRRHLEYTNPLYENPQNIAPINVGTIRGGDWPSTVPDQLMAEGRFGVLPGESVEAARKQLAVSLRQASSSDTWLGEHPPELIWYEGQFESGQTPVDSPIVTTLSECHAAVLGKPPALRGVTYGSDLRLFTNHANIPAVLYGPGNILHAHTVDEYVDLEEVMAATKVLALLVMRWSGSSDQRS
jgi:acetylornithine deacetylase